MVRSVLSKRKKFVLEDFMPYSCSDLTEELVDYAQTYLNETEKIKQEALSEVKEFIKEVYKVNVKIPDLVCLCFLRVRKFDVRKSCLLMKKFTDFIDAHKLMFDRVSSNDAVRSIIQSKVMGFLPYRDPKGRAILFFRLECWDPSELSTEDLFFGSVVSMSIFGDNPVNQVTGCVIIFDMKNFNVQQFMALSRWIIFGVQAVQSCCPYVIKEVHIIHASTLMKTLWNIIKPIIHEKIRKRVNFYKSTGWNSLHRKINPVILPKEFGGQLGPYTYEHWASDIEEIQKKYRCRLHELLKILRQSKRCAAGD